MGLFNKMSKTAVYEAAYDYVTGLKPFVDEIGKESSGEINYGLVEYFFYPFFTYLCKSTCDWKSIQGGVVEAIYQASSYTKMAGRSKADDCARISMMINSLVDEEKKALKEHKNPVKAMLNFGMNIIEGNELASVTCYISICNIINTIIKSLYLNEYSGACLPSAQALSVPENKTLVLNTKGKNLLYHLKAAFDYDGIRYYCLHTDGSKNILVQRVYKQDDGTYKLLDVPLDIAKEVFALFMRL